jgi:hypothetical protein
MAMQGRSDAFIILAPPPVGVLRFAALHCFALHYTAGRQPFSIRYVHVLPTEPLATTVPFYELPALPSALDEA